MAHTVNPFIVMDYETGGLKSNNNPVVELAMIALHGATLEEIGRFECIIHPYDETLIYDKKAEAVHGISRERAEAEGLLISACCKGAFDLIDQANKTATGKYAKTIIVGHNITFDIAFLQAMAIAGKRDLSKHLSGKEDHYGNFQPEYIDTMNLGKMMFQADPTIIDFKLGTVLNKIGIELNDAHRAMNDVEGTKAGFIRFIQQLRNGSAEIMANTKERVREHFKF